MDVYSGRALVVDDEHSVLEFCQAVLEQMGYAVETSLDGAAALKRLEHDAPFDLMLLDLHMPGINGVEVLEQLRSRGQSIAVIVMTGYGTLENTAKVTLLGAQAILLKPFSLHDLRNAAQEVLRKRQSERSIAQSEALHPLVAISERLLSQLELPQLRAEIVKTTQHALGADQTLLLECTPDQQLVIAAKAVDRPDEPSRWQNLARWVTHHRQQVVLSHDTPPPSSLANLPLAPDQALVCTPLIANRQVLGALLIERHGQVGEITPAHTELFTILAGLAAIAIENAQRHAEVTRAVHQRIQAEKLAGMGRLTTSIAHEVNNPLQALQSSLNLLVERPMPEERRAQILQMAHEQVGQLVGLVQQMMDLYRPARDGMRPISPHELLESVLTHLEPRLRERGIMIKRDWESPLPRVRGVSSQLKQVFSSLILNAYDAMPRGGTLTVRTQVIGQGHGRNVCITVTDTGNGIAAHELSSIFEPFYSTYKDRTGLSLAVSYSIIEQHEGTLAVESGQAGGTTFAITLPAL